MENESKINDLENRLSDLERRLRAALQQNDPPLEAPTLSPGVGIFATGYGDMKQYAVLTWWFLLFFAVVALGCFVAFEMATTTKYQLLCMTIFLVAIMGVVQMKLWYWLIWNRYSIVRETKRLELRIAELMEKLEKR